MRKATSETAVGLSETRSETRSDLATGRFSGGWPPLIAGVGLTADLVTSLVTFFLAIEAFFKVPSERREAAYSAAPPLFLCCPSGQPES